MNPQAVIALVVLIALLGAGYLWYTNQPAPLPPQVADTTTEEEPAAPTATQIENSIEGTWRSSGDSKFTRAFANGQVTDRYQGNEDATVTGSYELNGTVPAQVKAAAGTSAVLAIQFPEETLFFVVTKLSATELELRYVGGSGVLRFKRTP